MRALSLVYLLFFCFWTNFSQATNLDLLKCEQFTIDNGLPQSFIEQVFQDEKGFLWIATQDGISKFNGYTFENFFSNPFDTNTISSNYVINIDTWNEDSVIFTTSVGLSIFDPVSKTFSNRAFKLKYDEVGNITSSLVLNRDSIFIGTEKGLFQFADKGNSTFLQINKRKISKIIQVKNTIFFTSGNELYQYVEGKEKLVGKFDSKIEKLFSQGNRVYFSLKNSFHKLTRDLKLDTNFKVKAQVNDFILEAGKLWLATQNNGVVIYDPTDSQKSQQYSTSLLSKKIRCIFKDSFGVIWIGSDKGLNKVDPSKKEFLHYKASDYHPESSNNCWSFFENDSLLISGYDNGLQVSDKQSGASHWVKFDGLILDIESLEDQILLATSRGVFQLISQQDSFFISDSTATDFLINDRQDIVFKFFKHKNKLLVGSYNYLSIYDENLTLQNRWEIKGVRDFSTLNDQVYFTASPTGIYQLYNINDPQLTNYRKFNLPELEHLMGLSIAAAGENIWLGLYGGGLIQFDYKTKKSNHFSTKDGLPNNTIYAIVKNKNSLWLSTNGGLSEFNLKTKEFTNFNNADGIQSLEFNSGAYYKNKQAKIYFGGINGYNIVNPEIENKNNFPPEVYISSIIYNGENILQQNKNNDLYNKEAKTITIPHRRNKFEILVDGLHYSSPNNNIFKTKLEGWQNDWKISKGKSSFQFSNLKDGEYFFVVNAANADGVWSYNEQRIKIIIKPPFYLTWWFISAFSVVVIGLIAFLIYSRANRSKFQREILEKKVRDRTREVENQKKKLEEKNKELEIEKNKEEEVLLNVLPRETAKELVSTGKSTPKSYKMATVMFADFKNFTKITENLGPKELVAELDDSFAKFDDIVGKLNIEKIKTSGDAYMCVGGVPIRNQTNPVDCVLAAFQFQKYMHQKREIREGTGKPQWHLRIGMHTGALVAGVVGKKKFLYDVWGDTVNTAARMETSADEGKINVSGTTYEYIRDYFDCEYRGKLPVKNKGAIDMYYINRIKAGLCKDEEGQTPNRKFFELLNFKVYTQQNFHNVRDYFIDLLEQNEFVSKLKYHGPHHTLDVMEAAERIGRSEGLGEEELMLVKVAALFHDSGFLNKYQNNEPEGAKLAKRELPRYGFTDAQVEIVEGMILATKIPQEPNNHLEEILCDADLDYLGREKEEFDKISTSLAQELIDMKILKSINHWDPIQVKFLEAHQYFTKTCIQTRRPGKIERLREIKDRLKGPNVE